MKPKSRRGGETGSDRVPLATVKTGLSRYVREVQVHGRTFTITQHGRDAALLAPATASPRVALAFREPLDPRPLGALGLRPARGTGATSAAIRRALDEERGE